MRYVVLGLAGLVSGAAMAQGIPATNERLDAIGTKLDQIRGVTEQIRDNPRAPVAITDRLNTLITTTGSIDAGVTGVGDRLDLVLDRLEDISELLDTGSQPGSGAVQSYRVTYFPAEGQGTGSERAEILTNASRAARGIHVTFNGRENTTSTDALARDWECRLEVCLEQSTMNDCDAGVPGFTVFGRNRIFVTGSVEDRNVKIDFPAPMTVYALGISRLSNPDFCQADVAVFYD
ncbi:MAG: hypothetical protein MUC71_03970 [Steroidobacteraceae bacterium]|jgi:hypothetical protein|nr:hypothetical protein [Steroidobacteraceae bacterium]